MGLGDWAERGGGSSEHARDGGGLGGGTCAQLPGHCASLAWPTYHTCTYLM